MSTTNNEDSKETFDLVQAANFLHMSTSALRVKIKTGEVQAAKPAKKWVFLRQDLVVYIRSKYTNSVEKPFCDSKMENTLCRFTKETKRGGSALQHRQGKEYDALLRLETKSKRKSSTIR